MKKKRIPMLLLCLICVISLTSCGKKNENTIVVGTNAEFPPFEYIDNDGEIAGFDVALMKAIGDEIGYDIKFTNMEFKSLLGAISTGGIDAAIAGMTITDDRKESVDFSDPYFSANQYIIVQIDNEEITTLEDLNGKKISVQEGTTGDLMATPDDENEIITDKSTVVKRFKKGTDAVLELKNGGVDAVIIDSSPAQKFVAANADSLKYIPIDEETAEPEEYGIAVAKGNSEIVELLNEGLAKIKENGVYDELIDQYFGDAEIVTKKTSDNWFVQQYYTFKYVFIETEGYHMLLDGLFITLKISVLSVLFGVALGMILALLKLTETRRKHKTLWSVLAGIYIDIIRGTPVVVQLLIMYMVVFKSQAPMVAAVVTFGMNSAAYVAEIIRAGILAVDNGQMEGGRSLGFTYGQTMRYIIIPQAVKNILPALCNEFIALIKETSIVGYVAIQDLTKASDFLISRTYETFMPLIVLAIIYYIIVKGLSKLFSVFERRLRKSDIR